MLRNELEESPAGEASHVIDRFMTDELKDLTLAMAQYGYQVRVVGGAVRDLLLGGSPRDIDLATDALPDEIIYIAVDRDLEVKVKGIGHGTVRVVFAGGQEYEITSLAYSIHHDGGRLQMQHANDWKKDALRRDYTMNALSMDLRGRVYDYIGGFEDLKHQRVRLIGTPEDRFSEDPVLAMRFFRMASKLGSPKLDKRVIEYLGKNPDVIDGISPKRFRLELEGIRAGRSGPSVLELMDHLGVAAQDH